MSTEGSLVDIKQNVFVCRVFFCGEPLLVGFDTNPRGKRSRSGSPRHFDTIEFLCIGQAKCPPSTIPPLEWIGRPRRGGLPH